MGQETLLSERRHGFQAAIAQILGLEGAARHLKPAQSAAEVVHAFIRKPCFWLDPKLTEN